MRQPPNTREVRLGRLGLAGLILLAAGGAIRGLGLFRRPPDPAPPPEPPPPESERVFPLTPPSDSPYLNTGPAARYVGSESCRACHPGRHESFRHTGMGRSMAAVDPAREPPGGEFDHAKTGVRYRVTRENGRVWHREVRAAPGQPEVVTAEFPVKYVVGSGHHSLTYLAEADGFLVESPVTWYAAGRGWGMSPGYDVPEYVGFQRAAGVGCLHCHSGRAEAAGGSLHRMTVTEAAIGCERCHGPGSLHADRHRGRPTAPEPAPREADLTIVNPARLPRALAEAVCRQCHLRTTAVIPARGRELPDFRPGLPFEDFAHAYQLRDENGPMTVVGHVEQLGLSRCYQKSDRLTCLTCHSPHAEPPPERRVGYYRAACQTCHPAEHCKVSPDRRARESPENDCVRCHMPRSPTEVPHLAFTHHRIGVHDRPAPPAWAAVPDLVPVADLSRFPDVDRRRSLGLGYLEAASREKQPDRAGAFRARAADLLTGVRAAGLRDPAVDVALARLRFEGAGDALPLADAALAHPGLAGQDRCTALFLKADALAAQRRHAEAVAALRELVTLRRHPTDWVLLADCERAVGHAAERTAALAAAVRIDPRLWRIQAALADEFRLRGDAEKAAWHRLRAVP